MSRHLPNLRVVAAIVFSCFGRSARGALLLIATVSVSYSSIAHAEDVVSQEELLKTGRPAGLFVLRESHSKVCDVLNEQLNARYQAGPGAEPNDVLFHTDTEITWQPTKYRTLNGKTSSVFVADVPPQAGFARYQLFNERGSFDSYPHEFLFYVLRSDADAARDKDGILSTAFIATHTDSRSKAAGVVSIAQYVTQLYGSINSEPLALYGPGNRFTASVSVVDGNLFAILGPAEMFDPRGVLKKDLTVFVTGIPQDQTQALCRFSM